MKDFDKKQFWIWALSSVFWFCIILFLGISMRLSFAIQIKLPTPFEYTRHAQWQNAYPVPRPIASLSRVVNAHAAPLARRRYKQQNYN